MSANEVLSWMSARREGSWLQFRGAVECLCDGGESDGNVAGTEEKRDLPLHQLLRFNLQRLGHAEFFVVGQTLRWRIAPPVLVVVKRKETWMGLATGARTNAGVRALATSGLTPEFNPQNSSPDRIILKDTDMATLEMAARASGMVIQRNAPDAILACLPPIDAKHLRSTGVMPIGTGGRLSDFVSNVYVGSTLVVRRPLANGHLFRFESEYEKHYLLSPPEW